jgi:ATP-binding cassette subfamily F protein 3
MIQLQDIYLSFNGKTLFNSLSLSINEKNRIGLVGNNGTGKTTLFHIILGKITPDRGLVEVPKNKTIGYLPQDLVELEPINIIDFLKNVTGLKAVETTLKSCEHKMAFTDPQSDQYQSLLKKYEEASHLFSVFDGYSFEAKSKKVLHGLGFEEKDYSKLCTEFSGGWKMKILLASILLSNPDIMLLDEPTNHLDTENMEWMEKYLEDYSGTLVTISHDRRFLDKITQLTFEIFNGKLNLYHGNYSFYLKEKDQKRLLIEKEIETQRKKIEKTEAFIERFRYKATKAAQVQSRIKMLEKFNLIEMEKEAKPVSIHFPPGERSSLEVLKVENLSKKYDSRFVFKNINFSLYRGEKVALAGVNGAGKSTLTRIISGNEDPTSGQVIYGDKVKIAFFSQESAQNLNYAHTIWEEISSIPTKMLDIEKRNLLGAFLFSGDDIYKPIPVLSGGEKARLTLVKILMNETNFLILDEPTNHLDMSTNELFQRALMEYSGTVLIVSHDRYFLDNLVERVIEIQDGKIYEYPGNYSYYNEKREQRQALSSGDSDQSEKEKTAQSKKREIRRIEAEARNFLSRKKREIQSRLLPIEDAISKLEKKKSENESLLCDPSILTDSEKVQTLMKELKEINEELAVFMQKWETIAEEMDQLNTKEE